MIKHVIDITFAQFYYKQMYMIHVNYELNECTSHLKMDVQFWSHSILNTLNHNLGFKIYIVNMNLNCCYLSSLNLFRVYSFLV